MGILALVFLSILAYTYILYPIILYLLTINKQLSINTDITKDFPITVIIPAHNEEEVIREKIEDTCYLIQGFKDKLIWVISDGSSDKTVQIAEEQGLTYPYLKVHAFEDRGGKTRSINWGVEHSLDGLIMFTDANVLLKESRIDKAIALFNDERIGCVCGEKRAINYRLTNTGKGISLYARWELKVKDMESSLDSVVGADGGLFIIRKELFSPLPLDVIDDFATSLNIRTMGYWVVLSRDLIGIEPAAIDKREEFRSKVRVISRAWKGFLHVPSVLSFFKHPLFTWEFISHKILRWLSPFFLLGLFLFIPAAIGNKIYIPFMLGFLLYLCLSMLGWIFEGFNLRFLPFAVPYYFSLVNLAALLGLFRFLRGGSNITWQRSQSARYKGKDE